MINKIKNKIEIELPLFISRLNKAYSLNNLSPLLFNSIQEFVTRSGKRARPILFIIGYLGFAKKEPKGLYTSALSLELLHDFMLVHDDIIDKSELRRGKPAMHTLLNHHLKGYKNIKFSGEDLAIIVGDVMYAMGLKAFLSVEADPLCKEKSLKKLIDAAIYTGCGEFIEVLSGIKEVKDISKEEIYKIYDFKTACYTFASPLSMGALLAGALDKEADILFDYGIYLGRAFQIKDDILGLFGTEKKIGKSVLTDLQEAKKTILIWYAYQNAGIKDRLMIKEAFSGKKITYLTLKNIQRIITETGALDYAKKEILQLINKANGLFNTSCMQQKYKDILHLYSKEILNI